jgi:hypothetical protein
LPKRVKENGLKREILVKPHFLKKIPPSSSFLENRLLFFPSSEKIAPEWTHSPKFDLKI